MWSPFNKLDLYAFPESSIKGTVVLSEISFYALVEPSLVPMQAMESGELLRVLLHRNEAAACSYM